MRRLLAAILLLLPSMAVAQGSFAVPTYTAGSLGSSATVATPSFSPGGGSYSSTQTVTISTATSLAVLCYTTDGSTPTESGHLCSGGTTSTYSTPISVATTQTVKAIGTKATYTDSAVGSAAYTISASHALTVVHTGTCTASGGGDTSLSCTVTAWTSGNTGMVFCPSSFAQPNSSSVGTFVTAPPTGSTSGGSNYGNSGVIKSIPASTTSFTIGVGAAIYGGLLVCEFYEMSGVNTTSPIDVSYGWSGQQYSLTPYAATTTQAYDSICAFVLEGSTITAGSGYTSYRVSDLVAGGSSVSSALMECTTTNVTPGTYTPAITRTGNYFTTATIAFTLQ